MKVKARDYRKAIVAVVGAVVAVLAIAGFDIDPEISTAVIALATAALVARVPNESA